MWDWSSSSSSSSSDDDWEQEHKSSGDNITANSPYSQSLILSAPRYKRGGKWVRTSGDDIPDRAVVAGEPQKIVRIAQYLHRWPALCLKTCQKQKFK